ncbi:MAG TPA: 4Fe-4S dicluster domain-containing protein [Anaerolineales bacterium]|jgi:tetrathionate reductase subunit B|nr:4Fe-4S dicluster domain-containing protein [Anaerolineales bacterium]
MAAKKRYGFVIDVARCIDCRACLVACSVENNVPMNHTRIWVKDLGVQGEFPDLQRSFVPYNCMHCDNPPCIEVCVSGATYKDADTGLVLVDQEACIGCGYCVEACPYDARYLDEKRGVVDKCTGCIQRVEIGQQPACVATCLGGARMFGDLNDPQSEVSMALKDASSVQRLDYEKNGYDTGPNIYYLNAGLLESSLLPRDPRYTLAEEGWKKVLVPAIFAGIGASFLVQATYFTKQLVEGEKEFEE